MITLLASLVGFISSIFPELIKILKDKNDKSHELKILDKQLYSQKEGLNNRLEEIDHFRDSENNKYIYRTYKTGINCVDSLNGTVRPVLAYSFFILYALVKIMQIKAVWQVSLDYNLAILWNEDDHAIFAGVISFYYGQRAMNKAKG